MAALRCQSDSPSGSIFQTPSTTMDAWLALPTATWNCINGLGPAFTFRAPSAFTLLRLLIKTGPGLQPAPLPACDRRNFSSRAAELVPCGVGMTRITNLFAAIALKWNQWARNGI